MSKNIGSPVTFSDPTPERAASPVIFLGVDDKRNRKPVSESEAAALTADSDDASESPTMDTDDDTPTIVVEDSFFDVDGIEYILKERHKDIANGTKVRLRNDEGSRGQDATVVATHQLLAGDLTDEHAKALGYESLAALADDRELYDDQEITVVQIKR